MILANCFFFVNRRREVWTVKQINLEINHLQINLRASAVMASLQPQLRVNKGLFLDVFQKDMGFVQRQIKPCRHYFLTLNFKHGFAAEFKRK